MNEAWAAGFYEGEGYVGIKKQQKGRVYLRLSVGQRTLWPLEQFLTVVGVGKIRHRVMRGEEIWYYEAGRSHNVLIVLGKLWPYLSPRRIEQARVAINKYLEQHPEVVVSFAQPSHVKGGQ